MLAFWSTGLVHSFHLAPRHMPMHSQEDVDTPAWSPNVVKLRHGEHLYVYHNYTTELNEDSRVTHRHLGRETILHHRQVLRTHIEPRDVPGHAANLTKRGFAAKNVSPLQANFLLSWRPETQLRYVTWSWKRASPNCAVIIYFCFKDQEAQQILKPIWQNAAQKWHTALGEKRGVDLQLAPADAATNTPAEMCPDAQRNWYAGRDRDTVQLEINNDAATAYNGPGWKPGRTPGRMKLNFETFK